VCPYLRRDYNGQSEEQYHLVDEPFDYSTVGVAAARALPLQPELRVLTNPVRSSAVIEVQLPHAMQLQLAVHDALGRRVDILRDGRHAAGAHSIRWNPGRLASGTYFLTLRSPVGSQSRRVLVVR
jgi:hypothetical protein